MVFVVGPHPAGAEARALGSGRLELRAGPTALWAAALRRSLRRPRDPAQPGSPEGMLVVGTKAEILHHLSLDDGLRIKGDDHLRPSDSGI